MPTRRQLIEKNMGEVDKIVIGLQGGMLEAFEMMGVTLADFMDTPAQADMYMAVIFELLPPEAQEKMLGDKRLKESQTVLPLLKSLRTKLRQRPKH